MRCPHCKGEDTAAVQTSTTRVLDDKGAPMTPERFTSKTRVACLTCGAATDWVEHATRQVVIDAWNSVKTAA